MNTIQIFDPALCCSSGVCGADVDQSLVDFSADVEWARQQGGKIERFNLAQQPMAFAENAAVKRALENTGEDALPLIVVDGRVALSGRYPTRAELAAWLAAADAPTIFSAQVAELVALGASIAANCEPCFKFHYAEAKKLGVSAADMRRAVDLAQKVKDAPARAMVDLAQRMLKPDLAATESMVEPPKAQTASVLAAIPVVGAPADSGCCSPSSSAAISGVARPSKCC